MIELKNLSKYYNHGSPNEVVALDNIDFSVQSGEYITVMGRSGAGKSTLLNVIGCMEKFENGQYFFMNEDISKLPMNKLAEFRNNKIGLVLQDFALINEYSVIENVIIPLYFGKHSPKERKSMALKALEQTGISNLQKRSVGQLSGGQKQRVAIARAIVNNPDLVLADEPTGALDSKTSAEIMGLFSQLNEQGKTIIIITHDMNIAEQCKKIVQISDGQII